MNCVVVRLLLVLGCVFIAGCYAQLAGSPIPSYDGARLYRGSCASCHGISGAGDGPLVSILKESPGDLRTLSLRNQGKFPRIAVVRQIDGRDLRMVHGSRDMPVWGWQFAQDTDKRDPAKQAEARINALVDYLETIQVATTE